MTLRTRIPHPSGATSGPGRSRFSDGRLRHRRGRARPPHPEAAAVRRRAEALLGGSGPPQAPPPEAPPPEVRLREAPPAEAPPPEAVSSPGSEIRSVADPPPEETPLSGGAALRLAVRERLPVWLQARCGVEPRTVAAVAVVLVAAVAFGARQYWAARPEPVTAPSVVTPATPPAPAPSPGPPVAAGGAGTRIVVDVSGKVRDPGVRRLPAGSRVEDALAAAGGVRPGTDTTGLNRARVLLDGEQVVVGAPAQPAAGGPGSGAGPGSAAGPLSLAAATVEQLDGLPGVGPVLAQHIVEFRTARGGFRSVEELRQVDGIGERRFADLRKLVRP
ncbi:ComEA family DNA-binding protein [Streptomyces sp. NBC_00320]|uniref:ComEA family DNA-binding protein n=1 Tax=Streptomyces sp. NBC_00320 TaxID=2975711 RepID=UPI002254E439|nr:ComEA family DNA-binding protein [Streptomyces sp. NBC_00320]MCX5147778.1 ComEA family DNA-binding protein [Streptomyces sp. NBC_00320]